MDTMPLEIHLTGAWTEGDLVHALRQDRRAWRWSVGDEDDDDPALWELVALDGAIWVVSTGGGGPTDLTRWSSASLDQARAQIEREVGDYREIRATQA